MKTKEVLGLRNSLVLCCDNCARYHLEEYHKLGLTKKEVMKGMSISLLIIETTVVPYLRRTHEYWDTLGEQIHNFFFGKLCSTFNILPTETITQ